MTVHNEKIQGPFKFFTVSLVLTALVLIWLGWSIVHAFKQTSLDAYRIFEVTKLVKGVGYLDEVLTMSANMASTTGNPFWEQRYRHYEKELDAIFVEIENGLDPRYLAVIQKTNAANVRLVEMENEAFRLVRENDLPGAQVILSSAEYTHQKTVYGYGVSAILDHLAESADALIASVKRKHITHMAGISSLLLGCFCAYAFTLYTFRQWTRKLRDQQDRLKAQTRELQELNKTLEQRVQERTKELEDEKHLAVDLLREAEKSKETAQKAERDLTELNRDLVNNEQMIRRMFQDLYQVHEELKQAQSQLLQSEKLAAIGQLAAGIAHEINNPVGFITSNLQTLEQYMQRFAVLRAQVEKVKAAVEARQHEEALSQVGQLNRMEKDLQMDFIMNDLRDLVKESITGAERIRKIITNMRTFSRQEKEQKEMIKIEDVLESVLNIVWNEIKYKAKLTKDYGETFPVLCNAQKLGQVLINVLINAVQAIEGQGEISIRTYQQGQMSCIDIRDTGCGIAEANLKKIFDPFFTTKPVGQGTGLGLSISYDILKQHGGDMLVKSQVGKGSTFTIRLPIFETQESANKRGEQ